MLFTASFSIIVQFRMYKMMVSQWLNVNGYIKKSLFLLKKMCNCHSLWILWLVWIGLWRGTECHPSRVSSIILRRLQTWIRTQNLLFIFISDLFISLYLTPAVNQFGCRGPSLKENNKTLREPVITPPKNKRLTNLGCTTRQMKSKSKCVSEPVIYHFWKVL